MRVLNTPFSWRSDPGVPKFADEGCIAIMDASCGLCARGAKWIARHDKAHVFRIIPMQSPLGQSLMRHFEMDPEDPRSWLFLENGTGFASLDAVMRVGRRFGGVWHVLSCLKILPAPMRDALYGVVARNRYKVMGRTDLCAMPDAEIQARLLQ